MKDEALIKFATKLQELREAANMSKGQLSVEAECSKSYIGKIESGQKLPGLKTTVKFARALGIHIKDLFDFDYDYKAKD